MISRRLNKWESIHETVQVPKVLSSETEGIFLAKKQREFFPLLLTPQKLWIISFSSENHRFLDSLNSITEWITRHVWCLSWLVTSFPQSNPRRHVHLLNQQKSEKWSSVGSVQIHEDSTRVHIFCTQIDVILKADCSLVLLSTWSVLPIKLEDGKGMFLLNVFSLLHGSSDGNFRHLLRYEAGDFS